MSEHTEPYVPEPLYPCCNVHCQEEYSWPAKDLHWNPAVNDWICINCGSYAEEWEDENGKNHRPENPLSLADHLKSLQPRWVPVSERLPEFDEGDRWNGWAMFRGVKAARFWNRSFFIDGTISHWLDFTPPLPGEEVGG